MKSEQQIRERINQIESDERYKARPATVDINAPLALMQMGMGSEREALLWVLKDD